MGNGLSQDRLRAGLAQLCASYPPRDGSNEINIALLKSWWDVLGGKPWLTGAVFDEALRETLETVKEYLPSPGTFLDICRVVWADLDRERAKDALAALPPPPVLSETEPPPGVDVDYWNRNVAIGKARQRIRAANIKAWREVAGTPFGAVPQELVNGIEPNEAQIRAILAEMAGTTRRPPQEGYQDVEWKDGKVSHVLHTAPPRRMALPVDTGSQRLKRDEQPADMRRCYCGADVIAYPDGRVVDLGTERIHSCPMAAQRREADRRDGGYGGYGGRPPAKEQ